MINKLWCNLIFFIAATFVLAVAPAMVSAQSNVEVFGQNRIQKRKFEWKFFDTKHFRVYHYDKAGRQLGRYVAEEAEGDISIVEKKLGGQFPKRFNIILYNSYDEYRQSNVGLKDESPAIGNARANTLHIVDDKLVVYFTGEHTDLRHQIRSGMSLVVMQRMIFGENFKKVVKNSLMLNLPQWVTDGYIAYLVDGWDAKANSEWKGVMDAHPGVGFFALSEQYPELAGKAFWKFVASQYGNNTVKILLYTMQQKSSLDKAMREKSTLNLKVKKAYDSCMSFYRDVYSMDSARQEKPDSSNGLIALKVPKDNSVIKNVKVSPSGTDIGYVVWKDGMYTVFTQKTAAGQAVTTIIEGGEKDFTEETDPDYPMLAWSTTGNKLAVLYKKGDETRLRIYNNQKSRIENYVIPPNRFDRALSMAFIDDDEKLVFSAIKKSQTDLYTFTIKGSKVANITDDAWDDLSPQFISGGSRTGLLFLSNRPRPNMNVPVGVNELPAGPMNVFFYNTRTMRSELLQCTDVKKGHVTQPIQYGLENFAYLLDSNGINNKYVVLFARTAANQDSAYSVPVTNYTTSILAHQYNLATGNVADVVQQKDKYMVYFHEMQLPGDKMPAKILQPATLSVEKPDVVKVIGEDVTAAPGIIAAKDMNAEQPQQTSVIKGGTAFQSEFTDTMAQPKKKGKSRGGIQDAFNGRPAADSSILTEITDSAYVKMKPSPYRISFKPDFLSVKVDNTVLFTQYQSIGANGGDYVNPSLGALTSISLNDVMENHRISAGFQLPANDPQSAYFLQYQNFKHRMDWGILFIRKQDKAAHYVNYFDQSGAYINTLPQLFKSVSNAVQMDFSYPLDRRRSYRFHQGLRQDRLVEKVTDPYSLNAPIPTTDMYTSLSRVEFVFDNTITPALNILNGMRYKIYTEYMYGLNNGNRSCYNIGFDFRNYKKLYKNFILANRVAYAHSDGSSMVQYLLGGVDNWIGAQKDTKGNQPPADNYGFQSLATSMRGYKQYGRTGNNYAVFSTELRLPVITTFVKKPVQSAILKNLQLVAFADAGAAWKAFIPNTDNLSSTYSFPTMPDPQGLNNVFLDITTYNGMALGYGAGIRTSLLGYFIRIDAAWNIDGSPKPIVYIALGTDF